MSAAVEPVPTSASWPALCGACGAPATDIHLLPWADLGHAPERAVLACARCDPGGLCLDLDEWTLGRPDWRPDHDGERYTLRDHYLSRCSDVDERVVDGVSWPVHLHSARAVELVDALLDGSVDGAFSLPASPSLGTIVFDAFGLLTDADVGAAGARIEAARPSSGVPRIAGTVELIQPRPPSAITAGEFIAVERPPLRPYVATGDGHSVILARNTTLLIAGPPDVGKSLVGLDLAARLADDEPSNWLGLEVVAGLRVLLVPYPGEGSDEDVAERLGALVPEGAHDRLLVWDRWRRGPAPLADEEGIVALAEELRHSERDIAVLDTGPAFFSGAVDCTKGIPEEAHRALELVREHAQRPVSFVLIVHTRKLDRNARRPPDELEEIGGTFAKKADAAVVIRKEGDMHTPRRRVVFAKCRRGPKPDPLIASFPARDDDGPPRLVAIGTLGGQPIKAGSDAKTIADWVRGHDEPVAVSVICTRFDISPTTLKERRGQALKELGIVRERIPGAGNTMGWGTAEQWKATAERRLGIVDVENGETRP
jgi:hypothetical protein